MSDESCSKVLQMQTQSNFVRQPRQADWHRAARRTGCAFDLLTMRTELQSQRQKNKRRTVRHRSTPADEDTVDAPEGGGAGQEGKTGLRPVASALQIRKSDEVWGSESGAMRDRQPAALMLSDSQERCDGPRRLWLLLTAQSPCRHLCSQSLSLRRALEHDCCWPATIVRFVSACLVIRGFA